MWKIALVILIISSGVQYYINSQALRPETYMSIEELVAYHGYNVTKHSILTEDGYILSAFRIFSLIPKENPVLMIHGFDATVEHFLINVNTKSPAFKLVDEGFDVWLLNTRGNIYSKNHTNLDPNDKEFWDWTSAEIGRYDIFASIRFIKSFTHKQQVAIVGHSQGGTILISTLTLNHELDDSISVAVSLAGTGGSFTNPPFLMKLFTSSSVVDIIEYFGIYNIFETRPEYLSKLFTAFPLLGFFINRIRFDTNINNDDIMSLPYYTFKSPGGTSTKNLRFIGSILSRDDKKLQMPDNGPEVNRKLYDSNTPPIIDYSQIKVNVALFGGGFDKFIHKEDVDHFYAQLPREKVLFFKSDYHIDHYGFIYSSNDLYIFDLIQVLNKSFKH